jgi:NTE family protein
MTRRGLVLGAGGVLGFSWAVGALTALEAAEGIDLRECEVVVGTSAGSITAALLGCGVPVDVMLRHQQGIPAPGDPVIDYDDEQDGTGPLPPLPGLGVGSTQLLRHVVLHPRTVTPLAALSSVAPRGRATLDPIRRIVDAALAATDGGDWTPHPATWVVAMDYDSGKRVAFGSPGAPPARLPDAVAASCAIPGWFTPSRSATGGTSTGVPARPRRSTCSRASGWTRCTSWRRWCRSPTTSPPASPGWSAASAAR